MMGVKDSNPRQASWKINAFDYRSTFYKRVMTVDVRLAVQNERPQLHVCMLIEHNVMSKTQPHNIIIHTTKTLPESRSVRRLQGNRRDCLLHIQKPETCTYPIHSIHVHIVFQKFLFFVSSHSFFSLPLALLFISFLPSDERRSWIQDMHQTRRDNRASHCKDTNEETPASIKRIVNIHIKRNLFFTCRTVAMNKENTPLQCCKRKKTSTHEHTTN